MKKTQEIKLRLARIGKDLELARSLLNNSYRLGIEIPEQDRRMLHDLEEQFVALQKRIDGLEEPCSSESK